MSFKFVSADEIRLHSRCAITRRGKVLQLGPPCAVEHEGPCDRMQGHPSLNTVSDRRMGPRTPDERCASCDGRLHECGGHTGHIELVFPAFLPQFVGTIKSIIGLTCARCLAYPARSEHCNPCIRACRAVQFVNNAFTFEAEAGAVTWDAERTLEFLQGAGRASLVATVVEVMPTNKRPFMQQEGVWVADPRTAAYADLARTNEDARLVIDGSAQQVERARADIQRSVNALFDARTVPELRSDAVGLMQDFLGKEGLFRHVALGKRVKNCARSVVVGDSCLGIGEVGLPFSVAATLSYPELVGPQNELIWQYRVACEPFRWNSLRTRAGDMYLSGGKDPPVPKQGDVVCRPLCNGDYVVVNRQPTLHRAGMQAHRVRLLHDSVVRLNQNVTIAYAMDFDGDEVNIHAPQTVAAVCDAQCLLAVREHLESPNMRPAIGFIQNALLGAFLMTQEEETLTWAEACQIAWAAGLVLQGEPGPVSGARLFSLLLPADLNCDEPPVRAGQLLRGPVSVKHLGTGRGNLLHRMIMRGEGEQFMDAANSLLGAYMDLRGFSTGLRDCVFPAGPRLPNTNGVQHLATQYKARADGLVQAENPLQQMHLSGAKGTPGNFMQIAVAIGDRRGFCYGNYTRGLSADELFRDVAASRDQLVQSKRAPAESGEMYRRMWSCLENLVVDEARQVVTDDGLLVQTRFGDDGLAHAVSWRGRFDPCSPDHPLARQGELHQLPFCPDDYSFPAGESGAKVARYFSRAAPRVRAVVERWLWRREVSDAQMAQLADLHDRALILPGEAVGLVAAGVLSAEITQRMLDSKHHIEGNEAINRLYELFYAKKAAVHETRLRFGRDEEAALFCAKIGSRPRVVSVTRITPEDMACGWARRWRETVNSGPEGGIKLVLDAATLGQPLWDWCRGRLRCYMHSHEQWDGVAEVITSDNVVPWKPGPRIQRSGRDVVLQSEQSIVKWVFKHAPEAFVSTTDVHGMQAAFGIEAARWCMRETSLPALAQVNRRYVTLLVDFMCHSGRVVGATATGLGAQTRNVWTRACFGEPVKHITAAAVWDKRVSSNNVAAAVMTSRLAPLGSGNVTLIPFDY